jgi:hypothetical protein
MSLKNSNKPRMDANKNNKATENLPYKKEPIIMEININPVKDLMINSFTN